MGEIFAVWVVVVVTNVCALVRFLRFLFSIFFLFTPFFALRLQSATYYKNDRIRRKARKNVAHKSIGILFTLVVSVTATTN